MSHINRVTSSFCSDSSDSTQRWPQTPKASISGQFAAARGQLIFEHGRLLRRGSAAHDLGGLQVLQPLGEQGRGHARYAAAQVVEPGRAGDQLAQHDDGPARAEDLGRHGDGTELVVAALGHGRSPVGIEPADYGRGGGADQFRFCIGSIQFLNWRRRGRPERFRAPANPGEAKQKDGSMPLVDIQVIKGVFTPEQKTTMISKVTDAMVQVEGENMRPVTWVRVQEIEDGQWAIGGNPLTASAVKAMAAAK